MTSHYNPIQSRGFTVRKTTRATEAFALFGLDTLYGAVTSRLSTIGRFAALMLCLILVPFLLFAILGMPDVTSFASLPMIPFIGEVAAPPKPANIRKMEADFKALGKELEAGQVEMAAGPISPERGEELEQKAKEMEELQKHLDQYNRIAGISKRAKEVTSPTLPNTEERDRKKLYTTPGHLFVSSEAFKRYRAQGKEGWSSKVELKSSRLGRPIMLRGEEAVKFEQKAFDPATLSDLGTDAIVEVDRDRDLIRFEEPEIFTIRDVLTTVPTTADSIKFVKHTATERAAESQSSRGGLKKFLKITFEPDTVSVETIAVLSKVTEQDIDDAPRLVGYINGEMTLDVKVEEEKQLLWGTGTNGQLKGLFHADHALPEFDRAGVGDTLIDTIRRMRTDLRKKKVQPNFVTIDPLDWEEIELSKGTDDRYIWGLITDLRGPRIWSLRVVESDAMTNADTNERRILMGDGIRGATIYNRNDIRLAVGFVDDDFARNLRTLRAEERLALAVKRPFAFEYVVTADASS